jgi:hypothetical protein
MGGLMSWNLVVILELVVVAAVVVGAIFFVRRVIKYATKK